MKESILACLGHCQQTFQHQLDSGVGTIMLNGISDQEVTTPALLCSSGEMMVRRIQDDQKQDEEVS